MTSHFNPGVPEVQPQWLAIAYLEDDLNKLADVARTEGLVATVREATGGDPVAAAGTATQEPSAPSRN